MVGDEVRKVEVEIDDQIKKMPVWKVKRNVLLRGLLTIWRDGLELVNMMAAHGAMFHLEEGIQSSLASEHLISAGVYQALKWAMEYAGDDGTDEVSDEVLVDLVMHVAGPYQALVDALKLGAHNMAEFSVDWETKTLTVYEGGNLSGHDAAIVRYDHVTVPFHRQTPLVDDSDQLTTRWNAGQYREYWRWVRSIAENAETNTIMGQAGPLAPIQEIMKQPVVVEIPSPPAGFMAIHEDVTLTIAKAQGPLKWKIDSWHDCPLIQIGDHVYGVSLAIRTLAAMDDYMLRAAVLNDAVQYEKVSGLREERMIAICKKVFEENGWTFIPRYLLANPPKEIDGYATRGSEICIAQLKSTLRPQSPWEVYKRNTDIIDGIAHTADIVRRLGEAATGIVITDGYEGDYATWKESLATGVPVGTLEDLRTIAQNPRAAFKALAERAGVQDKPSPEGVPERSGPLCSWTIKLLDQAKPKEMS